MEEFLDSLERERSEAEGGGGGGGSGGGVGGSRGAPGAAPSTTGRQGATGRRAAAGPASDVAHDGAASQGSGPGFYRPPDIWREGLPPGGAEAGDSRSGGWGAAPSPGAPASPWGQVYRDLPPPRRAVPSFSPSWLGSGDGRGGRHVAPGAEGPEGSSPPAGEGRRGARPAPPSTPPPPRKAKKPPPAPLPAPEGAPDQAPMDAPFEFQYSYSETPKVAPIGVRGPQFSPFGPATMARPWTGGRPTDTRSKRALPRTLPEFDTFNLPTKARGVKPVAKPGPYPPGAGPVYTRDREAVLGAPLTAAEVRELLEECNKSNRQVNLGRDGLIHNMLDLIHAHWKRARVCKVKCKGVPTVDMDNVCAVLEDKTGGKIIKRQGGTVHLFRGRNYNYLLRPRIPLMLWKPPAPIYPRLIQDAPPGLTLDEADLLRREGRRVKPCCKLGKNGVYADLVPAVRAALAEYELAKVDCEGLEKSDYKKIGAKLQDLVPCVLLSFEREHILVWRGREEESATEGPPLASDASTRDGEASAAGGGASASGMPGPSPPPPVAGALNQGAAEEGPSYVRDARGEGLGHMRPEHGSGGSAPHKAEGSPLPEALSVGNREGAIALEQSPLVADGGRGGGPKRGAGPAASEEGGAATADFEALWQQALETGVATAVGEPDDGRRAAELNQPCSPALER